jgi:hypothetical protein
MPFYYSLKTFTAGREGGDATLNLWDPKKKLGNTSDASKRNTFIPLPQ